MSKRSSKKRRSGASRPDAVPPRSSLAPPEPAPRQRLPWIVAVVTIATLIGGIALALRPRRPPPTTNVVFVLVDTLRADRVGVYDGASAAQTPRMDRLAGESLVFERAYSPSSWTTPSLASLFLGQRPFEHRVQQFLAPLPQSATPLAEALRDGGYATGFISANTSISGSTGFDRGFDHFESIDPPADRVFGLFAHADASVVNQRTLAWVDGARDRSRPMFLFVQYMDPHAPYRSHPDLTPPRHPALALTDDDLARAPLLGPWRKNPADRQEQWRLSIGQTARLRHLYDGEVSWVDQHLGKLLDQLSQRGLLEDAIVVVTSDHGEELGEHGLYGHGLSLFENETRVPLLVRLPGGRIRGRVKQPVESVGLGASLLRQVGLDVPASFTQPALDLRADPGAPGGALRWAVSELEPILKYGVSLHRHSLAGVERKLLQDTDGRLQAVDLKTDPQELSPIPPGPADQALVGALDRILGEEGQPAPAATPISIDEASRRRLEALGYLVGGEPPTATGTAIATPTPAN